MSGENLSAKNLVARFQSLIALLLMVIALSLMSDTFLSPENGWNILRQISVNLCLSIGMTLIILTGGIDLSVGAILAFSGAVAAGLMKNGIQVGPWDLLLEFTVFGAVVAAVFVGFSLGLVQWVRSHAFQAPTLCGDPGYVQHRTRAHYALDRGISHHGPGKWIQFYWYRLPAGYSDAGVDNRVPGGGLCPGDATHTLWTLHFCGRW